MADLYVRSTDGSDADNGTTWALAKATLSGVAAIDAAGDTSWLSHVHAESTSGNLVATFAGTLASPSKLFCGNDGAAPPTALATSATVTTTGVSNIQVSCTGSLYVYGIQFINGTGATGGSIILQNTANAAIQLWESCAFRIVSTGASNAIIVNNTASGPCRVVWKNCTVKMAATGQRIALAKGYLFWEGGSFESGGTTPTSIFTFSTAGGGLAEITGVDLSNLANTVHMVQVQPGQAGRFIMRGCKMPSGWSGKLFSAALTVAGFRGEMHGCDPGTSEWALWAEDYFAQLKAVSAIKRTGGASDGTTGYSWQIITSNADARFPFNRFETPEISRWNSTVGSAITATIEVIHDSATNLKDDEIWLEVQYPGSGSFTLRSFISDAKADVVATAADQSTSTETWTGAGGFSNPNKQKLSVTFTPQIAGYLVARVCFAKATNAYVVYVDPKLVIT